MRWKPRFLCEGWEGEGEGERAEDEAAEDEAAKDGGAAETGEEKKNELGIDALWVYVVFYKKSHGNLCAAADPFYKNVKNEGVELYVA